MHKTVFKKLVAVVMVLMLLVSMTMTAFAAPNDTAEPTEAELEEQKLYEEALAEASEILGISVEDLDKLETVPLPADNDAEGQELFAKAVAAITKHLKLSVTELELKAGETYDVNIVPQKLAKMFHWQIKDVKSLDPTFLSVVDIDQKTLTIKFKSERTGGKVGFTVEMADEPLETLVKQNPTLARYTQEATEAFEEKMTCDVATTNTPTKVVAGVGIPEETPKPDDGNGGGTGNRPVATPRPNPQPSENPRPSERPNPTAAPNPTNEPVPVPTDEPIEPTPEPSENPEPTLGPPIQSPEPTLGPPPLPSESPEPTVSPEPTNSPNPTTTPTEEPNPTTDPNPTINPTPTTQPTEQPNPTSEPTTEPTNSPAPTEEPTPKPTDEPTSSPEPTDEPTPTPEPTDEPTSSPEPTDEPTPTPEPTDEPTPEPEGPCNPGSCVDSDGDGICDNCHNKMPVHTHKFVYDEETKVAKCTGPNCNEVCSHPNAAADGSCADCGKPANKSESTPTPEPEPEECTHGSDPTTCEQCKQEKIDNCLQNTGHATLPKGQSCPGECGYIGQYEAPKVEPQLCEHDADPATCPICNCDNKGTGGEVNEDDNDNPVEENSPGDP